VRSWGGVEIEVDRGWARRVMGCVGGTVFLEGRSEVGFGCWVSRGGRGVLGIGELKGIGRVHVHWGFGVADRSTIWGESTTWALPDRIGQDPPLKAACDLAFASKWPDLSFPRPLFGHARLGVSSALRFAFCSLSVCSFAGWTCSWSMFRWAASRAVQGLHPGLHPGLRSGRSLEVVLQSFGLVVGSYDGS
jgi:hypothetical protein